MMYIHMRKRVLKTLGHVTGARGGGGLARRRRVPTGSDQSNEVSRVECIGKCMLMDHLFSEGPSFQREPRSRGILFPEGSSFQREPFSRGIVFEEGTSLKRERNVFEEGTSLERDCLYYGTSVSRDRL